MAPNVNPKAIAALKSATSDTSKLVKEHGVRIQRAENGLSALKKANSNLDERVLRDAAHSQLRSVMSLFESFENPQEKFVMPRTQPVGLKTQRTPFNQSMNAVSQGSLNFTYTSSLGPVGDGGACVIFTGNPDCPVAMTSGISKTLGNWSLTGELVGSKDDPVLSGLLLDSTDYAAIPKPCPIDTGVVPAYPLQKGNSNAAIKFSIVVEGFEGITGKLAIEAIDLGGNATSVAHFDPIPFNGTLIDMPFTINPSQAWHFHVSAPSVNLIGASVRMLCLGGADISTMPVTNSLVRDKPEIQQLDAVRKAVVEGGCAVASFTGEENNNGAGTCVGLTTPHFPSDIFIGGTNNIDAITSSSYQTLTSQTKLGRSAINTGGAQNYDYHAKELIRNDKFFTIFYFGAVYISDYGPATFNVVYPYTTSFATRSTMPEIILPLSSSSCPLVMEFFAHLTRNAHNPDHKKNWKTQAMALAKKVLTPANIKRAAYGAGTLAALFL